MSQKANFSAPALRNLRRLQICETADCKSALRGKVIRSFSEPRIGSGKKVIALRLKAIGQPLTPRCTRTREFTFSFDRLRYDVT